MQGASGVIFASALGDKEGAANGRNNTVPFFTFTLDVNVTIHRGATGPMSLTNLVCAR